MIRCFMMCGLMLCGCSAYDDLTNIQNTKAQCQSFQMEYEKVKPLKSTKLIDAKVQECKDAGAWEGDKK